MMLATFLDELGIPRAREADGETALLQLPETERAVLVLYHQEECSYEAIADTLNMPIGTVRTHLHRGRRRLSEAVGQATRRKSEVRAI